MESLRSTDKQERYDIQYLGDTLEHIYGIQGSAYALDLAED